MSVRIICTGGTFNKVYDPIKGRLGFDQSQIPAVLAVARSQLAVTELMLVDSLEMTETSREQLIETCRHAAEDRLVVVHGTDTMVDSARLIAAAGLNKTIVLTGAMVPNRVNESDAPFNLGYAVAAAQLADADVWIAMNARLHRWHAVVKNRGSGVFESS